MDNPQKINADTVRKALENAPVKNSSYLKNHQTITVRN